MATCRRSRRSSPASVRAAGIDEVIIGGDVLPGPMPRESLALVLDLGIPTRITKAEIK